MLHDETLNQAAADKARRGPPAPSSKAERRPPKQRPQFPQPLRFNLKKYYRRSDLDYFKLALAAFALGRPDPVKPLPPPGDPLVPQRQVAEEFGVTSRSLDRWVEEAASSEALA